MLAVLMDDHVDRLLSWSLVGPLLVAVVRRRQSCAQHVHEVCVDAALASAASSFNRLPVLLHSHAVGRGFALLLILWLTASIR